MSGSIPEAGGRAQHLWRGIELKTALPVWWCPLGPAGAPPSLHTEGAPPTPTGPSPADPGQALSLAAQQTRERSPGAGTAAVAATGGGRGGGDAGGGGARGGGRPLVPPAASAAAAPAPRVSGALGPPRCVAGAGPAGRPSPRDGAQPTPAGCNPELGRAREGAPAPGWLRGGRDAALRASISPFPATARERRSQVRADSQALRGAGVAVGVASTILGWMWVHIPPRRQAPGLHLPHSSPSPSPGPASHRSGG